MSKIVSNFYLIKVGGKPSYVGYTNRPIEIRFREHLRDKDFGDELIELDNLGSLEYDFTWNEELVSLYAREVSTKETELILEYGTQDSIWQKGASGNLGGQTWSDIKHFVRTNQDSPKFKFLPEDTVLAYLNEYAMLSTYIGNFVNHMNLSETVYMQNFVNNMNLPETSYISSFVNHMNLPEARYIGDFINTMKLPEAKYMSSFVSTMKLPEAKYMSSFVSTMELPETSYIKNFVNNMNLPETIYMHSFVSTMKLPETRYISDFVNTMNLPIVTYMKHFVGNMKKPVDN